MPELIFRGDPVHRGSIPESLADLSLWPDVDVTALAGETRDTFRRRRKSVELFIEQPHVPLKAIQEKTGINPKCLYEYLQRCFTEHPDGRINGFRALIPHCRSKHYERTASPNATKGLTGAFGQLLRRFPDIKLELDRLIDRGRKPAGDKRGKQEIRPNARIVHQKLLTLLRSAGVTDDQYPFNVAHLGKRSLEAYIRVRMTRGFEEAAEFCGCTNVPENPPDALRFGPLAAVRPYELVEADAHKVDLKLTVEVPDPLGFSVFFEISRIWVIVLLEVVTRCALGYAISMREQYSASDVLEAIRNSVFSSKRRQLSVPGLKLGDNAGFPRDLFAECEYACWDRMRLDNHLGHRADTVVQALTETIGCRIEFGRPREPNDREFIEPFFRHLSRGFAHRLPGTTGASPDDVRRMLGDVGSSTRLLITTVELADLVEVVLANANSTESGGLGGRTPLEAMRHFLARPGTMIRGLRKRLKDHDHLLGELHTRTVRGSPVHGRRPHVNFLDVRYTNQVLANSVGLIGKKLRIYEVPSDIRFLYAYLPSGEELGPLIAARPWCLTPHSATTRREINRLVARGRLQYASNEDPVEVYLQYKRRAATGNKTAAQALSQAMHDAQQGRELPVVQSPPEASEGADSADGEQGKIAPKSLTIRRTIRF